MRASRSNKEQHEQSNRKRYLARARKKRPDCKTRAREIDMSRVTEIKRGQVRVIETLI